MYYDGRVYIGTAGGDAGARGQMGAYDAKTGQEVWKFYTIPGPGERFAEHLGGRFVQDRRRRDLESPRRSIPSSG